MPEGLNLVSLALAFLAIGAAATVKGAIGFGLPIIAVPAVASILDPRTAVIVVSIPTLFSNLMIVVRGGGSRSDARRTVPVMFGLVVGTVLGAQLLASLDVASLSVLLGGAALTFVGLSLSRVNLTVPAKKERYVSPVMGLASGVVGGSTNLFGLVLTSYLHTLRLPRKVFVFTVTLLFSIGGVVQILSYLQLGLYTGPIMLYALLAFVPVAIGTYVGIRLQDVLPARVWNSLVLVFISVSGLNLVVRGMGWI